MALPGKYEVGVGCLVVVATGLLAFMALEVGAIRGVGDHVEVDVLLDDAAGLSTGAAVSIAGVPIGRVEALSVDFDKARAHLSLDGSAQVREDAVVAMRARSVLGEKYLEVIPNSHDAPLLKDGDVITVSQGQVEIDQLVTKMAPLVAAIDPKVLQDVGSSLSNALAADPDRPARMLADAEKTLANLAVASEQLPALATDARTTLASVKRTSDDARPLIARLAATEERLDTLIGSVPPDQIPALLTELQAAVKDGRAVVTKLDGSTADLQELLDKANGITTDDLSHWAREEGVLIRLFPRKEEK